MKKLNNKGFVVSITMYSLFLLMVLIISYILIGLSNGQNSRLYSKQKTKESLKKSYIEKIESNIDNGSGWESGTSSKCTNNTLQCILENNTTPDSNDYYYYKGAVFNNYLWYEGILWRIVGNVGSGGTSSVLIVSENAVGTIYASWNKWGEYIGYKDYMFSNQFRDAGYYYQYTSNSIVLKTYLYNNRIFYNKYKRCGEEGEVGFNYYCSSGEIRLRKNLSNPKDISISSGNGSKNNPYIIKEHNITNLNEAYSGEYVKYSNYLWRVVKTDEENIKLILAQYLTMPRYSDEKSNTLYATFNKFKNALNSDYFAENRNNNKIEKLSDLDNDVIDLPDLSEQWTSQLSEAGIEDFFCKKYNDDENKFELCVVAKEGDMGSSYGYNAFRPIVYLKNTEIKSGKGLKSNPFIIDNGSDKYDTSSNFSYYWVKNNNISSLYQFYNRTYDSILIDPYYITKCANNKGGSSEDYIDCLPNKGTSVNSVTKYKCNGGYMNCPVPNNTNIDNVFVGDFISYSDYLWRVIDKDEETDSIKAIISEYIGTYPYGSMSEFSKDSGIGWDLNNEFIKTLNINYKTILKKENNMYISLIGSSDRDIYKASFVPNIQDRFWNLENIMMDNELRSGGSIGENGKARVSQATERTASVSPVITFDATKILISDGNGTPGNPYVIGGK